MNDFVGDLCIVFMILAGIAMVFPTPAIAVVLLRNRMPKFSAYGGLAAFFLSFIFCTALCAIALTIDDPPRGTNTNPINDPLIAVLVGLFFGIIAGAANFIAWAALKAISEARPRTKDAD